MAVDSADRRKSYAVIAIIAAIIAAALLRCLTQMNSG